MDKEIKSTIIPKKKETINIYAFAFLMFFVFIFTFSLVHMFLSNFLYYNISDNIFSVDIIVEAILAVLAFIVMLLWKNSYVFTQPKEKFTSSLKYGWFYLSVGGFFALLFIGPALKNVSGLIKGDIITKVNDIAINDVSSLQQQIYSYSVGETVTLEYYRNGIYNKVDVVLNK